MTQDKVLVIAAHPDDEVLGCGAAIAKHVQNGSEVQVVIMAEGLTSRAPHRDRQQCREGLSELARAAQEAGCILGVSSVRLHNLPDNRMDSLDRLDVVKVVEDYVARFRPDLLYTHFGNDLNIDHQVVNQAVLTACRPLPGHPVKQILFFEVPSSTEWQIPTGGPCFAPNYFVDVTETIELKLQALQAYQSEMRPWPHARSVETVAALAKWRGSTVGVAAAEAFMVGRIIVP